MDPQTYLAEIKAKLASSLAVASVFIVEERALPDQGYLRARMRFQNGDFLEIVEYFSKRGAVCDAALPSSVDGCGTKGTREALG